MATIMLSGWISTGVNTLLSLKSRDIVFTSRLGSARISKLLWKMHIRSWSLYSNSPHLETKSTFLNGQSTTQS
ncbi:putative 8 kDa protein [Rosa rugosa leaf distortion virus]|uniref:Putative 8 kDa protein n=1 Tax=Rosa rugosa leaf distortion virus TaxID=535898 RepID=M1NGZ8_9TOMB|nr:putative 8 kDa protein [Rosa rugosa leaf distortion virus]AGF70695.1 putative 8 kDa protein [Rosa rugosa leaf distortion virus]